MAAENRAKFIIDLVGNVSQRARSFGQGLRRLGADGSTSMRLLSRSVSGVNGILDKFDNKLIGFATGGGLVMAGKRVGEQSQRLTELGTRYNLTADQVNSFNQAVWQTAGNRKTPYTDLITATEKFLERTNDVDGSISQMDNIALAMKGIGLNAQDAGDLVSAFWTAGTKDAKAMTKALDGLSSVSLIGTGNLSDQVQSVPGIIKNTSWKKPEDIAQIIGMWRLAESQFNDPSQAASATNDFFDAIKNKDNQKVLRRNGVDVYKDKKQGIYKSPADLALEIGKAAKQKEHNLKDIFTGNSLQMMLELADKDKQQQLNGLSDPANIKNGFTDEKASKNIQTLNSAITSLTNAGEKFAQLKLAKPVQDLADAINSLSPEELDKYAGALEKAAKGIGAVVAARYAYRFVKWGKNLIMPGSAGGGAGGGGGGGLGVQNVFVTNWPVGMGSGGNSVIGGGKGAGMLGKAGVAGMGAAMITPLVEEGLDMAFGDSQYYANIKYAQNWSDFVGAAFGQDTVKKGADGQWLWLTDKDKAANSANQQHIPVTASPYLQGGTLGEKWNKSQAAAPTEARDFRQAITPPDGKITVEVSSKDSGLQVKTTEVKSKGVDLRVNTGYTYGGGL
ncbi:hypothetical protein B7R74_17285 [Yersinia pseudotuberculosis]|uniref:hypothetical protein n=1 Tax=Yersinia pseudotuberculosis TaxID=633 RepID=UPI000D0B4114|nr:hypothetical protein [Yersinia pseudotuberculosis]MBK1425937.1 hypothetical protein [Yersinia pseudotuberculosis]MBK1426460.1 hypothetical protein [Yersinia pseudotuberculosis]MBK1426465.1 hypothetical protein [Yersinia pseudotuberculosis]PSH16010.1 hypothetical protein B7R74_17285 [Yersinia pseudotuberculosis]